MKLQTLKPRLQAATLQRTKPNTTSARRMTGRKLQDRRLAMWTKSPNCEGCGRFVMYPDGFELDHKVALANDGQDVEDNCQILCFACHDAKTADDLGHQRNGDWNRWRPKTQA